MIGTIAQSDARRFARVGEHAVSAKIQDHSGDKAHAEIGRYLMTVRTSRKTVTFRQPFSLSGIDEVQPAGTYTVETDEELLAGFVVSQPTGASRA